MQPPQLRAHVREAVEALIRESRNAPAGAANTQPAKGQPDYEDEIVQWFQSIPPAMRNRRFSMEEIAANFRGQYRPRAAIRVIAVALRRLGWTGHRDWTRAGRNRRYWLPPGVEPIRRRKYE